MLCAIKGGMSVRMLKIGVAVRLLVSCGVISCGGSSPQTASDGPGDAGAPVDANSTCGAGTSACGGSCVDLQTDSANCGACGATCCGPCEAGACSAATKPYRIASHQAQPVTLAVDATHVYWTNGGNPTPNEPGAVMKAPRAGGAPVAIVPALATPTALAVAGKRVFWVSGGGNVMSAGLDGSTPRMIANDQSASALGASDTSLYFNGGHDVFVIPQDGSAPASSFLGNLQCVFSIVVDAEYVFFVACAPGQIATDVYRANRIGGGSATRLTYAGVVDRIAIDSKNVYWPEQGSNIMRVPRLGGTHEAIATNQNSPQAIVADGTNVYWMNKDALMVAPASPDAGAPRALAPIASVQAISGQARPLALDAACVYWADASSVYVMNK